jgi:hypothetical protein
MFDFADGEVIEMILYYYIVISYSVYKGCSSNGRYIDDEREA